MSAMKMRFFAVDALLPDAGERELNAFLASNRIFAVNKELVCLESRVFWTFCIEYGQAGEKRDDSEKKERVDYKEVLNAQEFDVYSRLRDLRKKLADEKGVPAYAVFTNAQLAEMVQRNVRTRKDLSTIAGVGDARVAEFGDAFLACLHGENDGTNGRAE